MTTHKLAKILLKSDDLPVATSANNHEFMSGAEVMGQPRETLKVGVIHNYDGDYILIGNFSYRHTEKDNWHVKKMICGEVI